MFKRLFISITVLLSFAVISFSQNLDNQKWGIGLQGGNHPSGLAVNYQLQSNLGLMGILAFDHAPHLAVKPRYRFTQKQYLGIYGWGLAGIRDHKEDDVYIGAGAGLEYDWRGLDAELPPIGWSIEAGLTNLDFVIGLGITWYL